MSRWIVVMMFVVTLCTNAQSAPIALPRALSQVDLGRQGQAFDLQPFQDDKGQDVWIKDFKRLTLLKIWGTFCGPCLEEIKELQTLRSAFSKDVLAIVPICIDQTDTAQVRAVLDHEGGKALPIFTDGSGRFINTLGITGVPVSILVDEEGKELWRKVGGPTPWGNSDVVQHFKDLLSAR